jgi:multidrug transporter EmrE-like cation transporter
LKALLLVILAGVVFSMGDVVSRAWGKSLQLKWFVAMIVVATMAYSVFGVLARENEFSKSAIWVSISLTISSCILGVLVYKDPLTYSKLLALMAALLAAWLSVQDW